MRYSLGEPAAEPGVPLVDLFEQVVQGQGHENETGHPDELACDTETEERLGGRDVVCRRRCVPVNDQLAGDIPHGEEAEY